MHHAENKMNFIDLEQDNLYLPDYEDDFSQYEEFMHTTQEEYQTDLNYCIWPSVESLFKPIGCLLMCCTLLRICYQYDFVFNVKVKHSASIVLGLYVIHFYFDSELFVYILGMAALSYFALSIPNNHIKRFTSLDKGYFALYSSIVCMILNELLTDSEQWNRIRSAVMLIAMKFISLAFDRGNNSKTQLPGFIDYFGYLFSPSTCIFGPWISFEEYMVSLQRIHYSWNWTRSIFASLLWSLVCFILSNCIITWVLPDSLPGILLLYRDALIFRTSHYFVSFLSDATCGISGAGSSPGRPLVRVTSPRLIEIPRSMVQVCVFWNFAMHGWLKKYVFKPTFRVYGSLTAVLMTYLMSSLLHGLNARLSAVLLSLGCYTYVEYKTRAALSKLFSACVCSRPCRTPCHLHKHNRNAFTLFLNFCYTVSVILHLAYLGALIDEASRTHDVQYQSSSFDLWRNFYFFSHIMVFGEFCGCIIIGYITKYYQIKT
ncbi:protein-serine O-palmitoleoyltransferase porcupine [Nilaparvata lugens]|uniref:protein-serine O-palmitoleoyltransferase porcupine n=1 Tax=Nilaparvata lugens TaxID=108931 RepID=UPI000B983DB9|nr:protein-serine O-palmitoleoyltransferase porcupine [Nilaparvata lugens]XP_022189831.1 protein-serine O-palmitoleoyltransferase porcupine [Nilaparvata lugens]